MSAIAGLFRTDGAPVTVGDLDRARGVLSIYGRDGGGIWTGGSVTLATCHAALGAPAADGGLFARDEWVVAADARIDNRAELLRDLGSAVVGRDALSDTELLWRCFEKWGEDCPRHLVGDYAFAIWDARKRRLFCARDHIGARPLYYYRAGGVCAVATDIRAVLAIPGVAARVDEAAVAQMLVSRRAVYFDAERTFLGNLRKLPFGNVLVCDERDCRVARHWRPEAVPLTVLPSAEDYVERLRELLRVAVADRITGVRQLGVHVSGGLDSSVLAVLAARQRRDRGDSVPRGYSWSPAPEPGSTDTEYAFIDQVVRQEALPVRFAQAMTGAAASMVDRGAVALGQDTGFVEDEVQRAAQRDGVQVLLSGWGGDQGASFAGDGLLAQLVAEGRAREIGRLLELGWGRSPRELTRAARQLWREGVWPWFRGKGGATRWTFDGRVPYVRRDFLRRVESRIERNDRRWPSPTSPRRLLWDYYQAGICTSRVESWTVSGAERGLTYVYPLLDRRVMEFAFSVPAELFWREGRVRWLFRQAAAAWLPATMLDQRSKRETGYVRRAEEVVAKTVASIQAQLEGDRVWQRNPWIDIDQFIGAMTRMPRAVTTTEVLRVWTALQIWRRWAEDELDSTAGSAIVRS